MQARCVILVTSPEGRPGVGSGPIKRGRPGQTGNITAPVGKVTKIDAVEAFGAGESVRLMT
jgi:hypothetical protein